MKLAGQAAVGLNTLTPDDGADRALTLETWWNTCKLLCVTGALQDAGGQREQMVHRFLSHAATNISRDNAVKHRTDVTSGRAPRRP